ncbi:MAG TPA: hypothetical protein VJB14_13745, partial [Planctomycetota bacterium]|nr:hypothetical protein [Planctomycetota bacterium]
EEGLDGLRRLGFAAEEPLWDALNKADPDGRARAAEVLKWLYTPGESGEAPSPRRTAGVLKAAHEKTLSIDLKDTPLTTAADFVREITGMNVHLSGVAAPDASSITFKGTDLPAHSALVLLLEPQGMAYLAKDETILIVPADRVPKGASLARNFWTAPDEARAIERQLASLGSSLPSERDAAAAELARLGDRAIGILEKASGLLEGEARVRCRALLASLDPSGLESPSAGGLQRRTPFQQAGLNRTADLAAEAKDLEALVKPYGEKVVFKAKAPRTFTFEAKGVTLETLLKALTPPQGLDFYLDGQTVVVDTAANVRAALAR